MRVHKNVCASERMRVCMCVGVHVGMRGWCVLGVCAGEVFDLVI